MLIKQIDEIASRVVKIADRENRKIGDVLQEEIDKLKAKKGGY